MLTLKNVSKTYKLKRALPVKALQNVSVEFQNRGLVFILGKSGSGKSTMLNVIGGLDKVDEGEIIIKGRSSKTFKDGDYDNYRNTFIGFVFQEYNLIDDFTIGKNIALALELQGHKATPETIHHYLEQVDMVGYEKRHVNQISSGQKQRVAIARALIKNPEIILADEPTGALDSNTGKQVLEILKKLAEDKLIIIVSHDRETAEIYGDRIIELKDGEIISDVSKTVDQTIEVKKGVRQNQNIIHLDKSYKLKNEDLEYFNKLQKENETLIVTRDEKLLETFTFEQTTPDHIDTETHKESLLELIKSKLKNLDSFKLGASGLKHKRFRLFMTILLSFVSLSFFALTHTMGSFNANESHLRTLSDNGINKTTITQSIKTGEDSLFNFAPSVSFSNQKINDLKEDLTKASVLPILDEGISLSFDSLNLDLTKGDQVLLNALSWSNSETVLINSNFLSENSYTLSFGEMPSDENEYLITSFAFNVFKKFGFKYYKTVGGNAVMSYLYPNSFTNNDLTNANLLFNKSFLEHDLNKTISGIVNISYDKEKFSEENLATMIDDYLQISNLNDYIEAQQLINFYTLESILDDLYYEDLGVSDKFYPSDSRILVVYADQYEYLQDINYFVEEEHLKDELLIKFTNEPLKKNEVILSYSFFSQHPLLYEYFYTESTYNLTYETFLNIKKGTLNLQFSTINEVVSWGQNPTNAQNLKNLIVNEVGQLEINDPLSGNLDLIKYDVAGIYFPTTSHDFDDGGDTYFFDDWGHFSTISVSKERQTESFGYSFVSELAIINYDSNLINTYLKILSYDDGLFQIQIHSQFSEIFLSFGFLFTILAGVFLSLGIVLAVFSSLLMMNFIAISIAFKKREIGILRGLGASKGDVIKIFGFESLIIASINIVLAILLTGPAVFLINQRIALEVGAAITLLTFGFKQILLILAIALVSAAIASILPVLRIARKKPIDAIYDR